MLYLPAANYTLSRWKNGAGNTQEILIAPAGATLAGPFLFRLSLAHMHISGPFSQFPGYDRTLVLLTGAGVSLHVRDAAQGSAALATLNTQYAATQFAGELAIESRLQAGPCEDFNVMSARSAIRHELEVVNITETGISIGVAPYLVLFAPCGGIQIDSPRLVLNSRDSAVGEGLKTEPCVRSVAGEVPLFIVRFWPTQVP